MKQYFQKYIDQIKNFKKRRNKRPKSVTLHDTKKDNYKCKRNQLAIRFNSFYKIKWIFQYKWIIISVFSTLVIALILFLLYWPVYTVKFINIIRKDSITNIDLAYNALSDIRWKRLFDIEDSVISQRIFDYQNNINYVDIDINFPNTLEIFLLSYPIYFQTNIEEKNFYITQNGTLIPGSINDEYKNIVLKNWLQSNIFPDYKKFFEQKNMENIYEAIFYFEQNIVWSKIKNILYFEIEKEVHFELENDNIIMFTLEKDLKQQIKKTAIFHTEHREITDDWLIYLDMRVSNKVFYCDNETPNQCRSNLKKIYPE